jgi:CBS domain-containing protein
MGTPPNGLQRIPDRPQGLGSHRFLYFSELMKRPVCAGEIQHRLGKLTDLVCALKEPYPEAVGIYLEHGWGEPTEFIPWDRVQRIDHNAIFVLPPAEGDHYSSFTDQPGWILLDKHLMGRPILDMDGRRTQVVNDLHLLEAKGRLLLIYVDSSFNGFLRKWGLHRLAGVKEELISWKYVQPLSVEDAGMRDMVSLSLTHKQLTELPSEDLADALEELAGTEQQALFSALDSAKAADTLLEAEPRAQRQLIATLRQERARLILDEMSVAQLANLFSVLPHADALELMALLPSERVERIRGILAEHEVKAGELRSAEFATCHQEARVGDVVGRLRLAPLEPSQISYLYVVDPHNLLIGVVDLRELLLTPDDRPIAEIMTAPVVAAEQDDTQEDLTQMFAKYHYRMLPVVDTQDHLLGVIRYKDIMRPGASTGGA